MARAVRGLRSPSIPAARTSYETIRGLTGGRGADVAIEALGRQQTFEAALRGALRPGGTLSSLGVYSGKLVAPYQAIHAGLGDQRIVTTLCPGGKERMRRLLQMVQHERVDLTPLITHRFSLEQLPEAYELFSRQADGVMKVAIHPTSAVAPQGARWPRSGSRSTTMTDLNRSWYRPISATPPRPRLAVCLHAGRRRCTRRTDVLHTVETPYTAQRGGQLLTLPPEAFVRGARAPRARSCSSSAVDA